MSTSKEQSEAFAEVLSIAGRIEYEQLGVPKDILEIFFTQFIKDMEIKAARKHHSEILYRKKLQRDVRQIPNVSI